MHRQFFFFCTPKRTQENAFILLSAINHCLIQSQPNYSASNVLSDLRFCQWKILRIVIVIARWTDNGYYESETWYRHYSQTSYAIKKVSLKRHNFLIGSSIIIVGWPCRVAQSQPL